MGHATWVHAGRSGGEGHRLQRGLVRMSVRAATGGAVVVFLLVGTPTKTTPAGADFTPVTAQGATAALHRSTAQIMAFGCDMQRHEGTAVSVGGGMLLTNQHVLAGTRLVDVIADGQPTEVGGQPLVATAGDVATVAEPGPALPALPMAAADPDAGSPVRVAGYPSALSGQREPGLTIVDTQVVDYVPGAVVGQPWPVMRLANAVRPGMSGGPVLDASGKLAGIVFGNELPTGEGLAIPVSVLRRLLASNSFVPVAC
jgi:S1-C subfamily serine protease